MPLFNVLVLGITSFSFLGFSKLFKVEFIDSLTDEIVESNLDFKLVSG